ncbi:MAG: dihydropteroate synthase [Betaproteobacteria bacterium]|nr:dihydropteroate synthase [Betaproteobacteria bacterium]
MSQHLHCGRFDLSLKRPLIMGIINLTDDSFSGDGLRGDTQRAIDHGLRLVQAGADILDLGAESSRPGATAIDAQQELDRLLPVLAGLRDCGVPLSVDTQKAEVMRSVLSAGADMINDITALQAPQALEAVAASPAAVCLMHMQGEPQGMQQAPSYDDVIAEVRAFLCTRAQAARNAGIATERIVLDPGFGFGKTLEHNLALLRNLAEFCETGFPLLVGLSRKSMLGLITGRPAEARLPAGIAAGLMAMQRGARIVRVHDVEAWRDVIAVWNAVEEV